MDLDALDPMDGSVAVNHVRLREGGSIPSRGTIGRRGFLGGLGGLLATAGAALALPKVVHEVERRYWQVPRNAPVGSRLEVYQETFRLAGVELARAYRSWLELELVPSPGSLSQRAVLLAAMMPESPRWRSGAFSMVSGVDEQTYELLRMEFNQRRRGEAITARHSHWPG